MQTVPQRPEASTVDGISAVFDQWRAAMVKETTANVSIAPAGRETQKTPKWETDARERVKAGVRKFSKPLAEMVARDANEGDTRLLVTDFLCETLGFDKFTDLATEYRVRGEFADYGVRIDRQLVAFVEVKRVTTTLSRKHLRQIESYAVNEGVEWMILTNGAQWHVYHLTPGMPVEIDLVLEVDLLGPDQLAKRVDGLFHITREGFKHGAIDDLWRARRATAPKAIAKILRSAPVVAAVRKELRHQKYRADDTEVLALIHSALRDECQ